MRRRMRTLSTIIVALLLTAALCIPSISCGKLQQEMDRPTDPIGSGGQIPIPIPEDSWRLPSIEFFYATPSAVSLGDIAYLEWDVFGATKITIDHGVGAVYRTGSTMVFPLETTTYTITAANASGSVTRSVTVTVGTTTTSVPQQSSPPPSQFTPSSLPLT